MYQLNNLITDNHLRYAFSDTYFINLILNLSFLFNGVIKEQLVILYLIYFRNVI